MPRPEMIDALDDLSKLENDYALACEGFHFVFVLTYTELYRYIYPVLEFLKSSNRNQYFTRQIALRHQLTSRSDIRWLVLRNVFEQYSYEIENAQERISQTIFGSEYEWEGFNKIVASIIQSNQFDEKIQQGLSGHGLVFEVNTIRTSLLDAMRSQVVKQELRDGMQAFEQLMTSPQVSVLPSAEELRIEADANFRILSRDYLDAIRQAGQRQIPISSQHKADQFAKVCLLNRSFAPNKVLYLIAAETNPQSEELDLMKLEQALSVSSNYGLRFPIIRSLRYFLLDAFFRIRFGSDTELLRNKVGGLRAFVEIKLESVSEMAKQIISQKDQPKNMRELLNLTREAEDVLREANHLPAFSIFAEEIEKRIRNIIGYSSDTHNPISSDWLRGRLSTMAQNPKDIFEAAEKYESQVDELLSRVENLLKEYEKVGPSRMHKLSFGTYHLPALSEYESRTLEPKISILSMRLSKWNDKKGAAELDAVENEIKNLLERHQNRSSALYVLLAGCARRRNRIDEAMSVLELATKINENNPEAHFEKAILLRRKSDAAMNYDERLKLLEDALQESLSFESITGMAAAKYYQMAANTCWKIFRLKTANPFAATQQETKELVEKALKFSGDGLAIADTEKVVSPERFQMLSFDHAYYLALIDDQKTVKMAYDSIRDFTDDKLSQAQLDTKAMIILKCHVLNVEGMNQVESLKYCASLYMKAIAENKDCDPIMNDGLAWALRELNRLGELPFS